MSARPLLVGGIIIDASLYDIVTELGCNHLKVAAFGPTNPSL